MTAAGSERATGRTRAAGRAPSPPLADPRQTRLSPACMQPAVSLVLLLGLLVSPALAAERLVGRTRVIDGDTIVVAGVHVRLQG
jgi:endonuclease YncB( thermonuclease family)